MTQIEIKEELGYNMWMLGLSQALTNGIFFFFFFFFLFFFFFFFFSCWGMRQILCLIARVQCHFICCLENGELGKQSVVLHLPAVYVC